MKAKRSKKRPSASKPRKKSVPKRAAKTAKPAKAARPAKAAKAKPAAKRAAKKAESKPAPAGTARPRAKAAPAAMTAATLEARRKEFAHHRDLLLKRQAELMQAYSISKGDSQSHLDNGTEDYIDYAVNSYAREFLLSLTEMDRKQLLMVEDALKRIDRGEFGSCQQCGEPVHPKRLEVSPWVKYCLRCQELEEQGLLPQYSGIADEESDEDRESEEGEAEEADDAPEGDAEEDEEEFGEVEEDLGDDDETLDGDSDDSEE